MSYKTVLSIHVETESLTQVCLQAMALASVHDAHLDALCMGVDQSQAGYYYTGASAMLTQSTMVETSAQAKTLTTAAKTLLQGYDGRWGLSNAVVQLADTGRAVGFHARFADLTVLAKPYGRHRTTEAEAVLEGALFEGRSPILVLPEGVEPITRPKRVVIGWNESDEALAAIRAALPMLQQAGLAHVVVVDPPRHGPDRSDPGGRVSQFLSRHGVRAQIDVLSKTLPRVSDVLLRHADDVNADLVVMGGYGHSRFREAVLGGATRHMLEQTHLPVLMAH